MSAVETILSFSRRIKNTRTPLSVFNHLEGEAEELLAEVFAKKWGDPAGPDGILGECIDIINCAVDLIYLDNPDITEEEITAVILKKCQKWEAKYGNA